METERLRRLLETVQSGAVSIEDALTSLRDLPFEDLGFANIDHHRALRNGFPEVIFGQGKTVEQIVSIAERLCAAGARVLATRLETDAVSALCTHFPTAQPHPLARLVVIPASSAVPSHPVRGTVLVCAAGTADLPVAEEAAITAETLGSPVDRLYDVGVAGLHRLLDRKDRLFAASVVVAVAGMEGALPSVVGGLVRRPVVAVPTSVGYGAHFHGLAPLLTMLNTCASGVAVMNIDNGFGGGYYAHLINEL
jgi:NCAIR mutase (PurE)-related protein